MGWKADSLKERAERLIPHRREPHASRTRTLDFEDTSSGVATLPPAVLYCGAAQTAAARPALGGYRRYIVARRRRQRRLELRVL